MTKAHEASGSGAVKALNAAYAAGFQESGEGYNAEYPFADNNDDFEKDTKWCERRNNRLLPLLSSLEQPSPAAVTDASGERETDLIKRLLERANYVAALQSRTSIEETLITLCREAAAALSATEQPAPAFAPLPASQELRAEIMRLMREDFDPHPNWELPAGQWDDNAEDVADKIISAVQANSEGK